MGNPYEQCPAYETETFKIRLIREADAENLLKCYTDIKARPFFNSDSCTGDFFINTVEEMQNTVRAWLGCYERKEFVRFSIVSKLTGVAVGTIEMFGMVGVYKVARGILRIDISSEYEKINYLNEIFSLCVSKFFDDFGVDEIATKAIPIAEDRLKALDNIGFEPYEFPDREHYYIYSK